MAATPDELKSKSDKPLSFSPSPQLTSKDFLLRFDELQKRAATGDSSSQLLVGLSLKYGWYDCKINEKESNLWIERAKKDDKSPAGICAQGLCFEFAIGGVTIKNSHRAKECYSKAAGQGYTPASYCLAETLYLEERANKSLHETKLDYETAKTEVQHINEERRNTLKKLVVHCAEQGFIPAQALLGLCYYRGYGVTQDFNEAMRLLLLAADAGFADAKNTIGVMCGNGEGTKSSLKEARKWYKLAAAQEHPLGIENAKGGLIIECALM